MAEKWFYAQSIPEPGEVVVLDAEETRHATRSRHLEIGSEATLFDGRGRTARVRLAEVSRRSATALVLETQQHPVPKPRLHLACALPKGDRVSTLLSMATQLGMTDFTPLTAHRSVVRPATETPERWLRIVREAGKQSRRPWQPVFHPPRAPEEAVEGAAPETRVWLMDAEGEKPEAERAQQAADLLLLVGPEGGFTSEETRQMKAAGARALTLSSGILRIETAAVAALARLGRED
ncbi:MAG: RsmE family RNA methyltransferase [Myxococcota bacterium]|nr:RsmE family RNA methyltransferase [Myxococcota bacterium]